MRERQNCEELKTPVSGPFFPWRDFFAFVFEIS
jgi:hypothetical protein